MLPDPKTLKEYKKENHKIITDLTLEIEYKFLYLQRKIEESKENMIKNDYLLQEIEQKLQK